MPKKYDPIYDPNFIGYSDENKSHSIKSDKESADSFFIYILNHLPVELKAVAKNKNLFEKPELSSKKFSLWTKNVSSFFSKIGVKWIHVFEEEPVDSEFDENFYVSLPEEDIICSVDGAIENSDVLSYVFISKGDYKARLKFVPYSPNDLFEDNWDDDYNEDDTEIDEFEEEY